MKRFSLITLFSLTITLSAFAFQDPDPQYSNLEFTILDAEAKTVSVKGINNASTDPIIIPSKAKDGEIEYTVTTIAAQGFYNYSKITKVVFPEGLTTIGNRAFAHCTAISDTIVLPSTLTNLYSFAAFYNVSTPAFVIKANTPPTISISEVYGLLPNIPIIIPSGTRVQYNNDSEWSKYQQMFCDDQSFTDGTYIYSVLNSSTVSVVGYVGNTYSMSGTVVIKANATNPFDNKTYIVTEIGDKAFFNCPKITSVQLSENIEKIGDKAFAHDSLIVGTLVLPASLKYIGEKVFYNLLHLDTLSILSATPPTLQDNATQTYNTVSDVFYNLPVNTVIQVPCNTLRTYRNHARWSPFADRYVDSCLVLVDNIYYLATDTGAVVDGYEVAPIGNLTLRESVAFGERILTVVAIADACFQQTKITSLSLPKNIVSIGKWSFYGCNQLTSLTLPENIATIAEKAFAHDSLIDGKLTFPSSLSNIGEKAFYNLLSLDTLDIHATIPPVLFQSVAEEFHNLPLTTIINIPCNSLQTYKNNPKWQTLWTQFVDPCIVLINNFYYTATETGAIVVGFDKTPSGDILFEETVTINGKSLNVVAITDRLLANNTYITSLSLPAFCTTLGNNSFLRCTNLKKISFNEALQVVGDSCFMGGTFDEIVMPTSLKTIGKCSFRDNTNLKRLYLNDGLQSIGERAFTNDNALSDTITLPSSIIEIGTAAFTGCENLTTIILGSATPPQVTYDQYSVFGSASKFIIPCGSMDSYKNANYWKNLSSKFVSACKPLTLKKGEALTQDTIVSSISFSRTFPMNQWQALYLPFEMDSMLVYDDGYWDAYFPFNSEKPTEGGYFYLYGLKSIDTNSGLFTFQEVHELNSNTPYMMLFIDKNTNYFEDKEIVFKSKQGEYRLTDNYTEPTLGAAYQLHGNNSLWEHSLTDGYTLSSSCDSCAQGIYDYKFWFSHNDNAPVLPFSWVVTPTKDIASKIMPAPRFLAGRWGYQPSSGGGDTPTSMQTVSESKVTYTQTGSQLTLYTQGQPCKVYAIDGTLLLSIDGTQDEVSIELNQGLYIIYSNGQSQKVLF